jgi:dTMP kinase
VSQLLDQSRVPGKFITVEGQDGAGKTTNLGFIEARMCQRGLSVIRTREPGGTELGELLRRLLLGEDKVAISDLSELLIVFAARAQHLDEVIRPALLRGQWVLCDRFTDATYAYQGGGREISVNDISRLENLVQGELRPDLTILLDLDVKTGAYRTRSRGEPDRFESEEIQFKNRVRSTYREIAAREPGRVKLIDAGRELDAVRQSLDVILEDFLSG